MIGENTKTVATISISTGKNPTRETDFRACGIDTKIKRNSPKEKKKERVISFFPIIHNRHGCVCLRYVLTFIGGVPSSLMLYVHRT